MKPADTVGPEHTANLLGALSLVLHDRTMEEISDAIGQSETAAAALSTLDNLVDEASVGQLHRILGLTPSGAVRLVDRLESLGYLERREGPDGRSTNVRLTRAGRLAARKVAVTRAEVLAHALSALSTDERQGLDATLSQLLVGMMREPRAQRFMCRLCDTRACGHADGLCPVRNAALERFGAAARG